MALFAKLYTDILGDEKLMKGARQGCRHLQLLPWLIAFAKKAEDDGRLTVAGEPAHPIEIARGIPSARAKSVELALKELASLNVLTLDANGAYRFTAWDKRSGHGKASDAPSAVAERVRRHRAKKQALTNGQTVQAPSIEGDVKRVTETRDNAREQEQEQEIEKEQEQEPEPRGRAFEPAAAASGAPAQLPTAETYAVGLATAANLAIAERFPDHKGPQILASGPRARQLAADLIHLNVPLEFARNAIVDKVRTARFEKVPEYLGYFAEVIADAVQDDQQRRANRDSSIPDRGGQPTRLSPADVEAASDRENEQLRRWERERKRAASAWRSDPANAEELAAIEAKARKHFADAATNAFSASGLELEIVHKCADAAGVPDFDTWLARQTAEAR